MAALRFSPRILDTYSRLRSQQRQSPGKGQKGLQLSAGINTSYSSRSQKTQSPDDEQKALQLSTIYAYSLRSQKRQNPDDGGQKELEFSEPNTLKRSRPDDGLTNDDSLEHNSSEESEEESECGSVDNEKGYYSPEQQRKDMKEMMNSNEYIDAMKSVKAGKEFAEKLQEK